jgi:opacity protein-like surface antigen
MNGKLAIAKIALVGAVASALCAPAGAADLSRRYTKEPPLPLPVMQPLYNWTGFYVGANFGGAFSTESVSNIGSINTDPSGVLGGVQLGYNYQFAPNLLLGIEGELDWTSASGSTNFGNVATAGSLTSNHNWYDTLDGRLGYVMGPWLFYVKGGFAWMNADYTLTTAGAIVGGGSSNITRTGWNVGAGAEYMIAPQWTAKAEYTYLDFGTDTVGFPVAAFGGANVNTQVHEFKVGLNYHWLPGTLFGRF